MTQGAYWVFRLLLARSLPSLCQALDRALGRLAWHPAAQETPAWMRTVLAVQAQAEGGGVLPAGSPPPRGRAGELTQSCSLLAERSEGGTAPLPTARAVGPWPVTPAAHPLTERPAPAPGPLALLPAKVTQWAPGRLH